MPPARIARPGPPDGCVLRVHTWPARHAVRVEIAARPGALAFHTHRRYLEPWNETHCPDSSHRLERVGYVFDHDGQPVDLSVCSDCPHAELTPGRPRMRDLTPPVAVVLLCDGVVLAREPARPDGSATFRVPAHRTVTGYRIVDGNGQPVAENDRVRESFTAEGTYETPALESA